MANDKHYMVAYDLHNATTSEYAAVEARLERMCGELIKNQRSVCWMANTGHTAAQIREAVQIACNRKAMKIWVTQAAADRAFHPPPKS